MAEVVGHRLEGEDGVDVSDANLFRYMGVDGGVVQDGLDATFGEQLHHFLSHGTRHGDYAYADVQAVNGLAQFIHRLDFQVAQGGAHDAVVGIEGGDHFEAFGGKAGVAEDGSAESTDADEADVPASIEAEDLLEFRCEVADVVASALLAETSEVAEVFSYLGGGYLEMRRPSC